MTFISAAFQRVSSRLTYANVIATLALFIALGGTSYAVTQLPANSVGAKQLRANAVTSAKVKNGSLVREDFKSGQLPSGQQGPAGPAGSSTGSAGGVLSGSYPNPQFAARQEWQPIDLNPVLYKADETYGPIGYYKDAFGTVHMKGLVRPSDNLCHSSSDHYYLIFKLPAGYRPAQNLLYPTVNNCDYAVEVHPNGDVVSVGGHGANISLATVSFLAEQ